MEQKCQAPRAIGNQDGKFHDFLGISKERKKILFRHSEDVCEEFQDEEMNIWDLLVKANAKCETPNEILFVTSRITEWIENLRHRGHLTDSRDEETKGEHDFIQHLLEVMGGAGAVVVGGRQEKRRRSAHDNS